MWSPVLLVILTLGVHSSHGRNYEEKRLINHLISQYEGRGIPGRPLEDASGTLNVTFSLSLRQLVDYDVREQLLTTYLTYFMQWQDRLLTWDPQEYDGMTSLSLPADKLYTPDVEPLNAKPSRTLNPVQVQVSSDGMVTWTPPLEIQTPCPIARRRGTTKVRCTLEFGSWSQPSDRLALVVPPWGIDRSDYTDNRDWRLRSVQDSHHQRHSPGNQQRFDVLKYELNLERW